MGIDHRRAIKIIEAIPKEEFHRGFLTKEQFRRYFDELIGMSTSRFNDLVALLKTYGVFSISYARGTKLGEIGWQVNFDNFNKFKEFFDSSEFVFLTPPKIEGAGLNG